MGRGDEWDALLPSAMVVRLMAHGWRNEFPDAIPVLETEGGGVHVVDRGDEWWIIRDETSALDLLDDVVAEDLREHAVAVERFPDRERWQRALEEVLRDVDPIAACLPGIAEHVVAATLPGAGGIGGVRERDLTASTCAMLSAHLGEPVAPKVIALPDWPRLGNSPLDFVSHDVRHVGELKWCQAHDDKVYEAIWDLFKLACAVRLPSVQAGYLVTGAPAPMWLSSPCRDLFDGGTFTPEELCSRRFRQGSRRTMWDYLLEGGYDRYPDRVPAHITTVPAGSAVVEDGDHRWLLRAVTVLPRPGPPDVPFPNGWPRGDRPADARRPIQV